MSHGAISISLNPENPDCHEHCSKVDPNPLFAITSLQHYMESPACEA
ncbi:hypothetical protein SAMN05216236_1139 [Sedimentitalea nanhaiensis]|uniref:Uncharacterized protein n=1 Tax=Sedimentitalea nanhaiensis TaxID=999627 RepID=A0A1I7BYH3_9RHOB|nr:hypothetical protein SAMN05216236_1139 [Sedimentitalea nanhaiensis]